jgi:hypothetical protein
MGKILFILAISICFMLNAKGQSITVDDLLSLSSLSSKNIDNYLNKKGFVSTGKSLQNNLLGTTFSEIRKKKSKDTSGIVRSINCYSNDDADYFVLSTSSIQEYQKGNDRLKQAGFRVDSIQANSPAGAAVYKKNNITIAANSVADEDIPIYIFSLKKRELPQADKIKHAEDLLEFDSHEYLVSYFGKRNVKEDVYNFSDKQLKKCSVLFPNTNQQATFIWEDEKTLSKISYILISGILPTASVMQFRSSVSENKWTLKNGIYSHITIRELLELNGTDFEFYGKNSEFSYMVSPESTGSINFKKTGLILGCFDCSSLLLNQKKISAMDAIGKSLDLYVVYIMIMP